MNTTDTDKAKDIAEAEECEDWVIKYWVSDDFWELPDLAKVKDCIAHKKNPKARDEYNRTPLHHVTKWNEDPAIIDALIEGHEAKVDARDQYGQTPLHYAAIVNRSPAIIDALVGHGAKVDARNEYGRTPLHFAASCNRNAAIIEALLDAGADGSIKDVFGKTPFDLIEEGSGFRGTDAYWRLNEARLERLCADKTACCSGK